MALPHDYRRRLRRVADPRAAVHAAHSRITSKRRSTRAAITSSTCSKSTCQTHLEHGNRVEILTNGDRFYPAMLDAIRARARDDQRWSATSSRSGEIGDRFIEALCRARARRRPRDDRDGRDRQPSAPSASRRSGSRQAGCRVAALSAVHTWYRLSRLNNRTHRELLVVDGARGVRRRRRRRRLVGQADAAASRCGAT